MSRAPLQDRVHTPLRPTPEQAEAADPLLSAWVGANAGSGKTRVLTQRVARLLLAGSRPERILCLTYTRAAAAEMQNRLFETLGKWAMLDDGALGAELGALESGDGPVTERARLAAARRLFAAALETPGGLKIQTIHAFCDALLRRFPLEAGVSPRFEVLDDRSAADLVAEARHWMAGPAGDPAAFDSVAARLNEGDVDALIGAVLGRRDDFSAADIEDRLVAHFGEAATAEPEELARAALARLDPADLSAHARVLAEHGGKGDRAAAAKIGEARALWEADPLAAAEALAEGFLTKAGTPKARRGFPTKAVLEADPGACARTGALIEWAVAHADAMHAREIAARARDLHRFARTLVGRYEALKAARGFLDFTDLVARAGDLLTRSDMRAWALYRLDAGLDHVLVDEAQDTSPAQWRVIRAIADEFHAGESARPGPRTLFVVGDEKQSIYSFQGAEPRAFAEERARAAGWLEGMGARLARPDLLTSFRSAPGILGFVDAVFEGRDHGLTQEDAPVRHVAHRAGDPGRVDLWPLVEPAEAPEEPEWFEPVDTPPPDSPRLRLADRLAGEISRMIAEDTLPSRGDKPARRVKAGDILVLVKTRDLLASALIRRLKARGVAVAGADRLSLAGELAVQDLLAAAKVATNRRDDLSLAALLRSPLCGLSEEELFAVAHGREGTLWDALQAAADRHPEAAAMLSDLADRADFLRPYEFLERILIAHEGQRRLLGRLGPEAAEVIDELLAQALAYERAGPPTLAGFVAWIETGDISVKREMDRAGDAVRVMTVHGAKGLEAPVVILPDTMKMATGSGPRGPVLLPTAAPPPLTLWLAAKETDDRVASEARAAGEAREAAESNRLLYVGLTRAEDWLILCGAGKPKDAGERGRWYGMLEAAMERLDPATASGPDGTEIRRLGPQVLPAAPARCVAVPIAGELAGGAGSETGAEGTEAPQGASPEGGHTAAPSWLAPAAREERAPRPAPSRLLPDQAAAVAGTPGGGRGQAGALAHGTAVHLLLERLAHRPAAERLALADRLLAASVPDLPEALRPAAIAEAEAVLAAPFAAEIFGAGSLAEAALALDLPEIAGQRMTGRIDRLVVRDGRALVVDVKTDAEPPAAPEAVSPAYLAQLAAYARGLAAALPGTRVEAGFVWTAAPALMRVPDALLEAALAGLPAPGPSA